jgi:hypothetical protein
VKTAKAIPTTWELTCPHCQDPIQAPKNGSHFWTAEDLADKRHIDCGCGEVVKVPVAVRRAAGGDR